MDAVYERIDQQRKRIDALFDQFIDELCIQRGWEPPKWITSDPTVPTKSLEDKGDSITAERTEVKAHETLEIDDTQNEEIDDSEQIKESEVRGKSPVRFDILLDVQPWASETHRKKLDETTSDESNPINFLKRPDLQLHPSLLIQLPQKFQYCRKLAISRVVFTSSSSADHLFDEMLKLAYAQADCSMTIQIGVHASCWSQPVRWKPGDKAIPLKDQRRTAIWFHGNFDLSWPRNVDNVAAAPLSRLLNKALNSTKTDMQIRKRIIVIKGAGPSVRDVFFFPEIREQENTGLAQITGTNGYEYIDGRFFLKVLGLFRVHYFLEVSHTVQTEDYYTPYKQAVITSEDWRKLFSATLVLIDVTTTVEDNSTMDSLPQQGCFTIGREDMGVIVASGKSKEKRTVIVKFMGQQLVGTMLMGTGNAEPAMQRWYWKCKERTAETVRDVRTGANKPQRIVESTRESTELSYGMVELIGNSGMATELYKLVLKCLSPSGHAKESRLMLVAQSSGLNLSATNTDAVGFLKYIAYLVAHSARVSMNDAWGTLNVVAVAWEVNGVGEIILCCYCGNGITDTAGLPMMSQIIVALVMMDSLHQQGYNVYPITLLLGIIALPLDSVIILAGQPCRIGSLCSFVGSINILCTAVPPGNTPTWVRSPASGRVFLQQSPVFSGANFVKPLQTWGQPVILEFLDSKKTYSTDLSVASPTSKVVREAGLQDSIEKPAPCYISGNTLAPLAQYISVFHEYVTVGLVDLFPSLGWIEVLTELTRRMRQTNRALHSLLDDVPAEANGEAMITATEVSLAALFRVTKNFIEVVRDGNVNTSMGSVKDKRGGDENKGEVDLKQGDSIWVEGLVPGTDFCNQATAFSGRCIGALTICAAIMVTAQAQYKWAPGLYDSAPVLDTECVTGNNIDVTTRSKLVYSAILKCKFCGTSKVHELRRDRGGYISIGHEFVAWAAANTSLSLHLCQQFVSTARRVLADININYLGQQFVMAALQDITAFTETTNRTGCGKHQVLVMLQSKFPDKKLMSNQLQSTRALWYLDVASSRMAPQAIDESNATCGKRLDSIGGKRKDHTMSLGAKEDLLGRLVTGVSKMTALALVMMIWVFLCNGD